MATRRDYYEILGISRDAPPETIKRAYRKLALANHPDRNPGDDGAVERFKEASEAFDVLSDADKRSRYDRFGHAGVSGGGHPGFTNVGDIFDLFGDLFDGFGIGGRARGRGPRAARGRSLRAAVTIDLLDAARGCSRTIELNRQELCDTCHGSGAKPGSAPQQCDYCGGNGQVVHSQGFFRMQTTCPACHGRGAVVREQCPGCRSSGHTPRTVKLDVTIPAGVDSGNRLCLHGEGEPGGHGAPRGDLYVDVHVHEHPLFVREGPHLTCHVPLTYSQAALGAQIDVPVLNGRQTLSIPAGTQPGSVFRIRGGGMPDPRGGRTGDLLIELQIEVPKKLSPQQDELLRKLAQLEQTDVTPHRRSFLETLKGWIAPSEDDDE